MRINHTLSFFLLTLSTACSTSYGQNNKIPIEHLNVPGPILMDSISYNLVWTSHPIYTYFLQEYIPAGDTVDKFNQMVLLSLQLGDMKVKEIVDQKISELTELQKTNPVVKYDLMQNKNNGEFLLTFTESENTPDGRLVSILEQNFYRYIPYKEKGGKKGVLLLGLSLRGYGDYIEKVFASIKQHKEEIIQNLAEYQIPKIIVTQ